MLTKNDILKQLECFKEAKGKPVMVHTSLRSIGKIEGGADTLIDALKEFFCADGGLLCIPTHTWKSLRLDLRTPESCLGALPSVAAAREDGVRSLHPTHSMTVFGDRTEAEKFVENEVFADSPVNPGGCHGELLRRGGYVLLLGVGQTKNTFLHCVEESMDVPGRLTADKRTFDIIHPDGRVEKRSIYWFDESEISDVSVNFGKFEPAFRKYGCITDGVLGNAQVQLCSTVKMKKVMELIYKNAEGQELLADNESLDSKLYEGGIIK